LGGGREATGSFIGETGFANFKRSVEPWLKETPEIGWVFAGHVHGQGYATEAVRAAVAWGDAHFGARQTACIIQPDNLASIRVAEKCGYRHLKQTDYKGRSTLVFVR
jgi:RimJ/RimL family protein N-acetyltransferase